MLLGTLLIRRGALTPPALEQALFEKERTGRPLGQVLVDLGLITTRSLAEALAEQHGLEFLDLSTTRLDPQAAATLPEALARRYQALPVTFENEVLVVAVADPTDLIAHDDLRFAIGASTRIVVADALQLEAAINSAYAPAEPATLTASPLAAIATEAAPAIRLVDDVIAQAVAERASDIHFEPQADRLVVRVRVDGVTRELMSIPSAGQAAVIARLKVMGGLDIAQRRVPQDGRVAVTAAGEPLDLRIAVLPTVYGERVVLRILRGSFTGRLDMAELGMNPETQAVVLRAIGRPYGAILACGPTGSGKTTTLYAALERLNEPGRVIVTIEDPVEYQLPGIAQIEIDPIAGLTFARGLRTILRSDPDVILVGEIRDEETAHIGMQAAATGHLVLSTLHAHSASSAVVRLKDMGVDTGLLAPSINCIIAQRLARRLCLVCRRPHTPTAEERREFGLEEQPADLQLFRPHGCDQCQQTGFQGRVALYEAMPVEGAVRRAISGSTEEIFAAAVEQGMTTLRDNGVALCLAGTTSLDEVHRVLGDRAL